MPGMMDTILNLGLNDEAVAGLAKTTGNERFARDSYRRLIQMYGEVVDGVEGHRFEQALTDLKSARGAKQDVEPPRGRPRRAGRDLQADLRRRDGLPFLQDARAQLEKAVRAVFDFVESPRAQGLPPHVRDPGRSRHGRQRRPDGLRQQGRRPGHGRLLHSRPGDRREPLLRRVPPERAGRGRRRRDQDARAARADGRACRRPMRVARDDRAARGPLPRHAGHRVHGRGRERLPAPDALGEGTAAAALCMAVEMVAEVDLDEEAVARIDPAQPGPAPAPDDRPGRRDRSGGERLERIAGSGVSSDVFDADTAEERGMAGESVILVRAGRRPWTTSTGWCRRRGSDRTRRAHLHAAVVARGWGTPCATSPAARRCTSTSAPRRPACRGTS